tara:strand:- start:205 stop:876 length:672 start_codon:yes stop_codon:yes gene_type:complete
MKLVLSSLFFFFLITCFSVSGQNINATYDIRVSSIKIGKLNWIAQLNNDNFSNEISLISEGLLSGLYSFEGRYLSEGEVNNQELTPSKYSHKWKTNKTNKKMSLVFHKNKLKFLSQEPYEKEHLRVNVYNIEKTKDPITSFLQIIMGAETALVVDGRRLYEMNAIYNNEDKQIIILINNYLNLWADHKRSKFEKIIFEKENGEMLPHAIDIHFDGRVFKLVKN